MPCCNVFIASDSFQFSLHSNPGVMFIGESVAEWLERWTCNPETLGSSPALTANWMCFTVVPSSDPRPSLYIASSLPPASWDS